MVGRLRVVHGFGFAHDLGRDASGGGEGWYRFDHHGSTANLGTLADDNVTEHTRARSDQHAWSDLGVPVAVAVLARATERHTVEEGAIWACSAFTVAWSKHVSFRRIFTYAMRYRLDIIKIQMCHTNGSWVDRIVHLTCDGVFRAQGDVPTTAVSPITTPGDNSEGGGRGVMNVVEVAGGLGGDLSTHRSRGRA